MSGRRDIDVLAVLLDVGLTLENSAVFQSQVADQFIALAGMGYAVGIIAIVDDGQRFDEVIGDRLRAAGVEIFPVADRGFLRSIVDMARALRTLRRDHGVRCAYVRGLWGPLVIALANPFSRLPYVYDVRGALADESRAVGAVRMKQRVYAGLEAWGIRRATRVSAVTRGLAAVVEEAHRVGAIEVVPCCVDIASASVDPADARRRRAELGYSDDDVVAVYAGGLSHYQQVPTMLALWRRLLDEPRLKFLLLTNDDPHSLPAVVGDLGDFGDRLRHFSLSRREVPATLAAADIGFMLRDSRELNRVASPVKFPEYLAAGLGIVASPGTGDASGLIESGDLGVLVDTQQIDDGVAAVRRLIATVAAQRLQVRERAGAAANRYYAWTSYRDVFARLYGAPRPALTKGQS